MTSLDRMDALRHMDAAELLVIVVEQDATIAAERHRADREAHGHTRYRKAWDQLSAHIDTAAVALQIAKN